jgi:hypothetical protein
MGTFLTITQDAERESATVDTLLTSVTSQTGRHLKFVEWVKRAWLDIQRSRADWLWMRGEFEDVALSVGTGRYTATVLGLTRWARWIVGKDTYYIYDPDIGNSDEGALLWMPWNEFRRTYERGSQTNNKPAHFSISPAGEFCVGPAPDKAYPLSGEYRKSPQTLSANGDEPECPERFHTAISDRANILMSQHDEAEMHIQTNKERYGATMGEMRRDQLPQIVNGAAPLA